VIIVEALKEVQHLYIETVPFIYYVEDNLNYSDKVEHILDLTVNQNITLFTSVITLAEALTKPLKTGDTVVEQAYRTLFQQSHNLTLLPVTLAIAETTASLRARYNLRTPDALHLATAINQQCEAFLTNDLSLRRVTKLRVLVLDELILA
jgi:predicted nucleic acid-binding protein